MADQGMYHPSVDEEVLINRRHKSNLWVRVTGVSGNPGSADTEVRYRPVDEQFPEGICFVHQIIQTRDGSKSKALAYMRAVDGYGDGFL